jgi:hypothetical protein
MGLALTALVTVCSSQPIIAEDRVSDFPTLVMNGEGLMQGQQSEQELVIAIKPAEDTLTIPQIIETAALEFGQNVSQMRAVAYCETTFRPEVIDGTVRGDSGLAVGLFQFHPDTWSEESRFLGYALDLRADPVASARVAAFMWSKGLQRRWSCYGR